MNLQMKRVDFENGTITSNILGASLPMLVAQILSLLYNIVDRIYIARIPNCSTWCSRSLFPGNCHHYRIQQSIRKRRCTIIFD